MRIVAIDAGALRGGGVSAAVEAAAAAIERDGGSVERFRVYASGPDTSRNGGHAATRGIDGNIAAIIEALLDSDGVLLGAPSTAAGINAGTRQLLRRIAACFAGNCLERGYHGRPTRLSPGRRVGLLTSSPAPPPLTPLHSMSVGPLLPVRRAFGRGGLQIVRHVSVPESRRHPLARDRALLRAAALGRELSKVLRDNPATRLPAFEGAFARSGRIAV